MSTNSNINGQKRCKCKKSQCLKLYCECFAAGLYCVEACSCQVCYNTLDYEDTVDEAREQVELRDPLAFSPKIDYHIQPPRHHRVEDAEELIPISAKHKKGCNCRKSMCLQRYCECYQANVGCTDRCRCEGCKNMYGKRGDYNVYNEFGSMRAVHGNLNNPGKDLESIGLGFSPHANHNPQNSTPWTASQHSDHGSNTSTPRRYIFSSEPVNTDMIIDTSRGNFDMVPMDQQLYSNIEFMNQVTPQDTTADINARNLTSMTNLPSTIDCPQSSKIIWNFSTESSLHFHGSPTPVTLFGEPKLNYPMEKPTETIHNNAPNIPSDSSIHSSTGSITSPGGE